MGRKPVGYNDMLFFESQDIDSDDTQGGDIDEFIIEHDIDVEMEQPNESSKSKYENMLNLIGQLMRKRSALQC